MRNKDGGPRGDRQRAEQSSEEHAARHEPGASPPSPAAPSPLPPEFAAAVQVTESERAWLREHLGKFYENELILDVVRRVKAGKEATVYVCSAHPSTGREWIAAKVYRERSQRSSKNVGQYQQGRGMLDEDGNSGESRSWRQGKSVSASSKRGKAAVQTSWLMHEFVLLQTLHAKGADVPEPIEHGENALLMEFIGDGAEASPTLNDVVLEASEAQPLFERVMFNVELLLELGWAHGDLSAYNILYRDGRIVLIDFPQVVDCRNNPRAREIFERDVERVSQYFESAGFSADPKSLARELWSKYIPEPDAGTGLDPDPDRG
jgi:RIO kinase 1